MISSLVFSTFLLSAVRAGGGAVNPFEKSEEKAKDTVKFRKLDITRLTFDNDTLRKDTTTNPQNPTILLDGSDSTGLLSTIAHGQTYGKENPFPRPFIPESKYVQADAKIWATVMSFIWLSFLWAYLYIKFSGRGYDKLFADDKSANQVLRESPSL